MMGGGGYPMSHVDFMLMSNIPVACLSPCSKLNLGKAYIAVTCHYLCNPLKNLRNGRVAMSVFRVLHPSFKLGFQLRFH